MLPKLWSIRRPLTTAVLAGRRWRALASLCRSSSHCSTLRLNFHQEIEAAISNQITEELTAGYMYFSMAAVFGRDDVALPGFHKLFNEFAVEEFNHAKGWVNYLNLRGGKAKFGAIKGTPDVEWTPLCATAKAIDMEAKITQEILKIRTLADKHNDPHFAKFVDDEYLVEQYDGLKKLSDLKTQIERVGDGEGLYILDSDILRKSPENPKLMSP